MPIREIAQVWQIDPATLHHEYARARQEFQAALEEVMRFHHPGAPDDARRELADLLALLD
jgi:RNA polymerase sigma-70 factor (ECF subfamily)